MMRIIRPWHFRKTLNMNVLECVFSVEYVRKGYVFEGLLIWEDEEYMNLQGSYPVIALNFAGVKETTFEQAKKMICQIIKKLYN